MLSFRNPFVTSTSKKSVETSRKEPHGLFVLYPTPEDKIDSKSLEAEYARRKKKPDLATGFIAWSKPGLTVLFKM